MGWNDHVELVEMECLDCGEIDEWEIWDSVAIARYGGDLGKKLGHDVARHNRCPHCGSERPGRPVNEGDEWWGAS